VRSGRSSGIRPLSRKSQPPANVARVPVTNWRRSRKRSRKDGRGEVLLRLRFFGRHDITSILPDRAETPRTSRQAPLGRGLCRGAPSLPPWLLQQRNRSAAVRIAQWRFYTLRRGATRPAPSLMTEAGRREVAYSRPVPRGRRWTLPQNVVVNGSRMWEPTARGPEGPPKPPALGSAPAKPWRSSVLRMEHVSPPAAPGRPRSPAGRSGSAPARPRRSSRRSGAPRPGPRCP
jgi:hypothetical protein